MENSKENKKYKLTPLEKRFVKIYILLAVFYSITSVYLLNTPIDEWVFNLGQYNNQLLELFPKAQYWVNISVAYREKMIPLYVLYNGIFWFIFVSTIWVMVRQWRHYLNIDKINFKPKCEKRKMLIFGVFLFGLSIYSYIFIFHTGSETYKLYEDLRVSLHGEYKVWSTVYGMIFYKLITGFLGMGIMTWGFTITIYGNIVCFKNNSTKRE